MARHARVDVSFAVSMGLRDLGLRKRLGLRAFMLMSIKLKV